MDLDEPESFVAHVPVPSQEEVSLNYSLIFVINIHVHDICTCICNP